MLQEKWMLPLLLSLVSIVVFANTFGGEFIYDDREVVFNPEVKYWHFWDLWEIMGRSTRTLSLIIDYHLFGDSSFGYHLQNVFWHITSVLLLYILIHKLSNNSILSFCCALLFAVHPIHVEAVANISNRKEMLCMAFILLSFIAYIQFLESILKNKWLWFVGSLFFWYLALNSKQVALALPLVLIAYEYIFLKKKQRFISRHRFILIACLVVLSALLVLKLSFFKNATGLMYSGTLGGFLELMPDPILFPITSGRTFWNYVHLLLFPINLSPDHMIQLSNSIFNPVAALAWIALLTVLLVALYIIRIDPLISFGLFWLLINYLPVSNLIPTVNTVADRYMYIPSAGFILVIASMGNKVCKKISQQQPAYKYIIMVILIMVSIMFSIRSIRYNTTWSKDFLLWDYAFSVTPKSYVAYVNRSIAKNIRDNTNTPLEAHSFFRRVIELEPRDAAAYVKRGISYHKMDNHKQAIRDFNKAKEIDPTNVNAYYRSAIAYNSSGKHKKAINDFEKVIQVNAENAHVYFGLGFAYEKLNYERQSIENYTRAIELNSEIKEFYYKRGSLFQFLDRNEEAIIDFSKAIEIDDKYAIAYVKLAAIYSKTGNEKLSEDYYKKAYDLGFIEDRDRESQL